jgi:tetratricopeptide (TPR) repeat protein
MKHGIACAMVFAGCLLMAPPRFAQAPAAGSQKPAPAQQKTPPKSDSNPFPEDTTSVPVMPSTASELNDTNFGGNDLSNVALPADDSDPARSPEDPANPASAAQAQSYSSSSTGLDSLLPDTDDTQAKHRKLKVEVPEHKETPEEDISVGKYYLDQKNWRAALSRFQSALVMKPEEPDVNWGLAESERHLGDFADAREYYQKVAEYDPDSHHGKEALKALRDPEIANAQKPSPGQTPSLNAK